jgi:hypothetical protein
MSASPSLVTIVSVEQLAHLFDQLLLDRVVRMLDLDALSELEDSLAIELARLPGIADAQMLAIARGLVGRALRRIAESREHPGPCDFFELRTRYDNALCREIDSTPGSPSGAREAG